MPIMAVHRFERFFRSAGGLDVDKEDLKRYSDFVLDKTYDMLVIAQATAKANGDVIEKADLPVTKGLRSVCTTSASSMRTSSWRRSCSASLRYLHWM